VRNFLVESNLCAWLLFRFRAIKSCPRPIACDYGR
jgi:hypothetical protein